MKRLFILLVALPILLGLVAWAAPAPRPTPLNLEKLLVDVFAPQPGEKVLVMVDLPSDELPDNEAWAARREMAREWHAAFQRLAARGDLDVYPLLTYRATGAHNGPLPEFGEMEGRQVRLADVLAQVNIALALTEYSATAPLFEFTARHPALRAASMPMVSSSMQETALAADYAQVANRVAILEARLDRAVGAEIEFSTGHQLYVDLRNREAHGDDGQLHADKAGERVINLPSGEAYIAPYEGELVGQHSRTAGMIPLLHGDTLFVLWVQGNRVTGVLGQGGDSLQGWFAVDRARRNIAELGLGVNDRAVVTGIVLEDEKVLGVHLAFGRSDHIGGTVGPDKFQDPANIVHHDIVYPQGGAIEVASLVLEYADGTREEIIRDGSYTVFPAGLSISARTVLLLWLFLTAGSLNFLAWDAGRRDLAPATKYLWAMVLLILGPLGLLAYLLSYRWAGHASGARPSPWWRALGASLYSGAGYAIGWTLVLVSFVLWWPERHPLVTLALLYVVPLAIGLLCYRAPLLSSLLGNRYGLALGRGLLTEVISTNLAMVALLLVGMVGADRWLPRPLNLASPLLYGLVVLVALSSALVVYAYNFWLARRGWAGWWLVGEELAGPVTVPSWRNAWGALLVSVVVMLVATALTILLLA